MHASTRAIRTAVATAVAVVGLVAVGAPGGGAQEAEQPLPPELLSGRPYSDASPFNTPVGDHPSVLANSDAVVANSFLNGGVPSPLATARDESINYDHPVYRSTRDDPLVTLQVPGKALDGAQINVPAYARPAGGTDGHLGIVAPDGYEYDLWQARWVDATTIRASIGYRQAADGLGITTPELQAADPAYGGGVAAMWGLRAGMIQAGELAAGHIDHALFAVIPVGRIGRVYPSVRSDAIGNRFGPRMGQRFWLDLSDEEIDATDAPGWEKTIAKAVHEYGAYFGDTGGAGFSFMLESSTPYAAAGVANPWDVFWPQQGVFWDPFWGYYGGFSSPAIWSHLEAIDPPDAVPAPPLPPPLADPEPDPPVDPIPPVDPTPPAEPQPSATDPEPEPTPTGSAASPSDGSPDANTPAQSR